MFGKSQLSFLDMQDASLCQSGTATPKMLELLEAVHEHPDRARLVSLADKLPSQASEVSTLYQRRRQNNLHLAIDGTKLFMMKMSCHQMHISSKTSTDSLFCLERVWRNGWPRIQSRFRLQHNPVRDSPWLSRLLRNHSLAANRRGASCARRHSGASMYVLGSEDTEQRVLMPRRSRRLRHRGQSSRCDFQISEADLCEMGNS